jgi:hypothetical protein
MNTRVYKRVFYASLLSLFLLPSYSLAGGGVVSTGVVANDADYYSWSDWSGDKANKEYLGADLVSFITPDSTARSNAIIATAGILPINTGAFYIYPSW